MTLHFLSLVIFLLFIQLLVAYTKAEYSASAYSVCISLLIFNVFFTTTAFCVENDMTIASSSTDPFSDLASDLDSNVPFKGYYFPLKTVQSLEYPMDLKRLPDYSQDFDFVSFPLDFNHRPVMCPAVDYLRHPLYNGYIRFNDDSNFNTSLVVPIKVLPSSNSELNVENQQLFVSLFQKQCGLLRDNFSKWIEYSNRISGNSNEFKQFNPEIIKIISKTNTQLFSSMLCDYQNMKGGLNGFVICSSNSSHILHAVKYLYNGCFDSTISLSNAPSLDPSKLCVTHGVGQMQKTFGLLTTLLEHNHPSLVGEIPAGPPNFSLIGKEVASYLPSPYDSSESVVFHYQDSESAQPVSVLDSLPFTSKTLDYDEELQTFSIQNLEEKEELFLKRKGFSAVAVLKSKEEGILKIFPVIPLLNTNYNLMDLDFCKKNAACMLESSAHFSRFLHNVQSNPVLAQYYPDNLEAIFEELSVLNRTVLLNTLGFHQKLYLSQLALGELGTCPSQILFKAMIAYCHRFDPTFEIQFDDQFEIKNFDQNLNVTGESLGIVPSPHDSLFNQLLSQFLVLENSLTPPSENDTGDESD